MNEVNTRALKKNCSLGWLKADFGLTLKRGIATDR
jgi:hypothetical protein